MTHQRLHDLLEFPSDFPVKIMGATAHGFADEVVAVVLRHAPDFNPATVQMKPSREGKFLSLTCTVRATSGDQLYALYADLRALDSVKMVL